MCQVLVLAIKAILDLLCQQLSLHIILVVAARMVAQRARTVRPAKMAVHRQGRLEIVVVNANRASVVQIARQQILAGWAPMTCHARIMVRPPEQQDPVVALAHNSLLATIVRLATAIPAKRI
jgi:hypothetical protein